jgi:hypothetical protein
MVRVIVLCGVLACSHPPAGEAAPRKDAAARWGATVAVDGGGTLTGDVLFVDAKGAVVQRAAIANGRYELAAAPAATRAVVRLESPAVGVRVVPIANRTAPSVTIAAADIVRLRGTVELPAGATFDWVELAVTPVSDEVPPVVVLWADAQGSLRGALIQRKLTTRTFELAVLRGSHRINVLRVVDGPKGSTGPAFGLENVQLDKTTTPATLAGATVKINAAGDARFVLRTLADSER